MAVPEQEDNVHGQVSIAETNIICLNLNRNKYLALILNFQVHLMISPKKKINNSGLSFQTLH